MIEKKGNESGLVCVWSISATLSPYMSIHFHRGQDSASSFGQRVHSAVLCWLSDIWVLWYQWVIPSPTPTAPTPPSTALSFLSFSFSTPVSSSGLYKLAVSTESEMPALTWPPGRNASPDINGVYSQTSVSDLQICIFCRTGFNLRSEKAIYALIYAMLLLYWSFNGD